MKEIAREKKLEAARCYLLGHTYEDIEKETGVSHGSIANIVMELENGKLTIPGGEIDRVNDLRQLALDLKKKGLQPSQALLGVSFSERLRLLGIGPGDLDRWSELAKKLAPVDFPAKDFLEAAFRFRELEESQGKPFETLADEYARLKEGADRLKAQVDSLSKEKAKLTAEVAPLRLQLDSLERNKSKLRR